MDNIVEYGEYLKTKDKFFLEITQAKLLKFDPEQPGLIFEILSPSEISHIQDNYRLENKKLFQELIRQRGRGDAFHDTEEFIERHKEAIRPMHEAFQHKFNIPPL